MPLRLANAPSRIVTHTRCRQLDKLLHHLALVTFDQHSPCTPQIAIPPRAETTIPLLAGTSSGIKRDADSLPISFLRFFGDGLNFKTERVYVGCAYGERIRGFVIGWEIERDYGWCALEIIFPAWLKQRLP